MPEVLSHNALSELIGLIYDCALDPNRWERTLAAIMDAFSGRTAILTLMDRRHGRLLINRTVGIEPYQMEAVARHAPEINARIEDAFASEGFSLGAPYTLSHHWRREDIKTSPYVGECVKPYGIVDILQYFLIHTPTHYSVAGWARHERHGIYTERDFELGGLLLPHLRRAVAISNVLDVRTIERARMAEALDALRCGVVLTNDCGVILYANRTAEEMLQAGDAIQDTRGVLHAKAQRARKELHAAIELAAHDEAIIGKAGLGIRLTEFDEAAVFAHVLPLTGGNLRTRLQPAAVAAVFIGAAQDAQDAAGMVAAAYGLTPAEARVLASLLAGRTLAETAASLRIAASTAKTHLDNIFLKTGVRRQAELIRLAMQVAPPAESQAK